MAGKSLSQWLKDNGLTQAAFAEMSGIPQTSISRICRGDGSKDETKRKIYDCTNGEVTPNWLVLGREA